VHGDGLACNPAGLRGQEQRQVGWRSLGERVPLTRADELGLTQDAEEGGLLNDHLEVILAVERGSAIPKTG